MAGVETTLGGSRENFPETVWSSVLTGPNAGTPEGQAARGRFFSLYWRPVYKFIRTAGKASIEDAKDLTQGFFSYLLEGDLLSRYQTERGRFRSFLKGILRNFLSETRRDSAAQKRGGGRMIVSLDVSDVETDRFLAEKDGMTPEEHFDRQWARDILLQGVADLRRILAEEGRTECLKVYETYELSTAGANPTYGETARALGLTEHQVKNHLDIARARLEQIVRGKLAHGVSSARELAEEMNDLFAT